MELSTESINELVETHILSKIKEFIMVHHLPLSLLTENIINPPLFFMVVGKGLVYSAISIETKEYIPEVLLSEIFPLYQIFIKYLTPFIDLQQYKDISESPTPNRWNRLSQIYLSTKLNRFVPVIIDYYPIGQMSNYDLHQEVVQDLRSLGNELVTINRESAEMMNHDALMILFLLCVSKGWIIGCRNQKIDNAFYDDHIRKLCTLLKIVA